LLIAARMQLETYAQLRARDRASAAENLATAMGLLDGAVVETRRLISSFRPPILDEEGVIAAIGHLIHDVSAREDVSIEFQSRVRFGRLERLLEDSVYRIVQECLTNAYRHGKAERIRIDVIHNEDRLAVTIQDWGSGFDLGALPEECHGLDAIRERTRIMKGEIAIETAPGEGTTVQVTLPISVAG